ncbi:MAG: CAP domain-containing protein [Salibacteraceae bacterium]
MRIEFRQSVFGLPCGTVERSIPLGLQKFTGSPVAGFSLVMTLMPRISFFVPWFIGVVLYALLPIAASAQRPSDRINVKDLNYPYLEHLVKVGIDSVRQRYDCSPLVNDSILFVAAGHHSDYMQDRSRLSHFEKDAPDLRTPQLRVFYFGGKQYLLVGENVLSTPVGTSIAGKKGRVFDGATYGGLAASMVNGWVNSPEHFQNIITPEFQLTGVALSYSAKDNTLYACQKFARVRYRYQLEESERLFPYSKYIPAPPRIDFSGIDRSLQEYDYEWNLRHDKPERCTRCDSITAFPPGVTLRVVNKKFVLRVENSEYVKALIQRPKDGFAVELVFYEDYACGNPAYYEKPSRRNGQCKLNGQVLEPVYRNDLYKGYKKRKVNKDLKFVSYLLQADTVPFFQRFARYKLARFSSEYFEMKLGRVPRKLNGHWNHNLVYVQRKQICHIDYFTGYCGSLFLDSAAVQLLRPPLPGPYEFVLDTLHLEFEVPFVKNEATFTQEDVAPLVASLASVDYTIDSVAIVASASVEGDSVRNLELQTTRAENLAGVFQEHQLAQIQTRMSAYTAWDHFYEQVRKSRKWRHLGKLKHAELVKRLNAGLADSLETILAEERKAAVDLYATIDLTERNLQHYLTKTFEAQVDSISRLSPRETQAIDHHLDHLNRLYGYAYRLVLEGRIDTAVLANLPLPPFAEASTALSEKIVFYAWLFPQAYARNANWQYTRNRCFQALQQNKFSGISTPFRFALAFMELYPQLKRNPNETIAQDLFYQLEGMAFFYAMDANARRNIETLNFNAHHLLLNTLYKQDPVANASMAYTSLSQLRAWYEQEKDLDEARAMQLARMAVFYQQNGWAARIVTPYRDSDTVKAFLVPLLYNHISEASAGPYYQYVLKLSHEMPPEVWCNLWLNNCQTPFQAFDHEGLRNRFCELCQEENEFLKELLGRD